LSCHIGPTPPPHSSFFWSHPGLPFSRRYDGSLYFFWPIHPLIQAACDRFFVAQVSSRLPRAFIPFTAELFSQESRVFASFQQARIPGPGPFFYIITGPPPSVHSRLLSGDLSERSSPYVFWKTPRDSVALMPVHLPFFFVPFAYGLFERFQVAFALLPPISRPRFVRVTDRLCFGTFGRLALLLEIRCSLTSPPFFCVPFTPLVDF